MAQEEKVKQVCSFHPELYTKRDTGSLMSNFGVAKSPKPTVLNFFEID